MEKLYLLILITTLWGCNNDQGPLLVKEYYESGVLKNEYYIGSDSIKNGLFKSYRENGQIHQQGFYQNGLKDGEYKSYHKNGNLFQHVNFHNDTVNGISKMYDYNGELVEEGIFKMGQASSSDIIKYKKWLPDGSKSAIYNGDSKGLYVWKNGVMEFSRSLTKEELEQAKNNTNQ